MAIHISERCHVTPAAGAAAEKLLPLLHFDIVWLRFHLMENLIFFSFKCSQSHFFHTILPNLKTSLSITLKHFLPLSGNIIVPLTSSMPVSLYAAAGDDAVSLTVAVSDADLLLLTKKQPKNADDFCDFVPQIPAAARSSESIKFSAAAIQITLFPSQGICIGFTSHHAVCDGASLLHFLQTWASINKFNGRDENLSAKIITPSYDRSVVEGANKLAAVSWSYVKNYIPTVSSTVSLPTGKLRGTFVLSESDVGKLKKFVMSNKPELLHLSSFVVVSAYIWSCLAKAAMAAGEEVDDDEREFLSCTADCRRRLTPPLPETYFGNCLALVVAESSHGRLKGREGIVFAAEATAEAVHKINNDLGILDGFENRLKEKAKLIGKRVVKVAGSPRFDVYGADFGWGKPEKFEAVHIDCDGAVSLCRSRDGGVEIGVSMEKAKMDAFAAVFDLGLSQVDENMHL